MDQNVIRPATEETYDGKGGIKIFFRAWRPEGKPRAVIVTPVNMAKQTALRYGDWELKGLAIDF